MPNVGSERVAGLLPNALLRTRGSRHQRRLYLTFDDGPHSSVTDELLALLGEHHVVASFFCIGENIERNSAVASRLAAAGHGVCNHSHTHRNYRRLSADAQRNDLQACADAITAAGGDGSRIFRAPQGQLSLDSLLRLRWEGWKIVHWNYDSLDYTGPSVRALLDRFTARPVTNGDIILFHDDSDLCVRVLRELLPQWRDRGFSFGSVTELQ